MTLGAVNQLQMRDNKKSRKDKRTWLQVQLSSNSLSEEEHRNISIGLSRASVTDKKSLQTLKLNHQTSIKLTSTKLQILTDEINSIKKLRKKLSVKLQKHFFKQYQMLNINGESKDLIELFDEYFKDQKYCSFHNEDTKKYFREKRKIFNEKVTKKLQS